MIYYTIATAKEIYDGAESFLHDSNQFKKDVNVTRKSISGFFDLLRKALNKDDWSPVVTHGTSPDLRWSGLSTIHISQFLDVTYFTL